MVKIYSNKNRTSSCCFFLILSFSSCAALILLLKNSPERARKEAISLKSVGATHEDFANGSRGSDGSLPWKSEFNTFDTSMLNTTMRRKANGFFSLFRYLPPRFPCYLVFLLAAMFNMGVSQIWFFIFIFKKVYKLILFSKNSIFNR